MGDKSLRVKLVIVSLLEHNLNQQISNFHSFNSTRKVRSDKNFGSSTFKTWHNQGLRLRGGSGARPPIWNRCAPPFNVWPPDCCIRPILYFLNVPPLSSGFWPLFFVFGPPATKSWRRAWTQPYQTSSSWAFLSLQFRWKFICLHV